MQYRFFTIPVHAGDAAAEDLNRFLTSHRILAVDRQLITDAANSAWAICVSFDEARAAQRSGLSSFRPQRIDYREIMTEPEFAVFARLRALRKQMAEAEGIPSYAIFNNDQLAQIVRRRIVASAQLRAIPGVGEARVGKYGEAFLGLMRDAALPGPVPAPTEAANET